MDDLAILGGGVSLVIMLFVLGFLLVLAILWFLLPFAVFGVKDKLSKVIDQTARTNDLLLSLNTTMTAVARSLNPPRSPGQQ